MKIRFAALLLIIIFTLNFCGSDGSGTKTLKLSLILGDTSDWYRGAQKFKELVEDRTEGKYSIQIYPHSQLANGDQRTELEMVQTGVIEMSFESSILLSLIEPRMSILSLPWLFSGYPQAYKILDSPLGGLLLDMLPEKGLVGLAYGANGFRQITNSRNVIFSPDDIHAMKIRVPAIKMYIDIFKLLGADPSSMTFGEVFTALAQGTMDGQENPVSVIHSARLNEVQKYLTVWNYSYDPIILCINKDLWDSFTSDTRDIFTDCASKAMQYERALVAKGEPILLEALREKGMVINTLDTESLEAFKTLSEPVYEKLSNEIGSDLIERFRAEVKE